MQPQELPLSTRVFFAFSCLFRVLFDGAFAARAWGVREPAPALPPAAAEKSPKKASEPAKEAPSKKALQPAANDTSALTLLALLQREARFVDFVMQDIGDFSDDEIGGVARVVHDGCKKALADHAVIEPVRAEEEDARVTLEEGYAASEVKLVGDVKGSAPYKGTLRHRGWKAASITLPKPTAGHDAHVIAPAEVEL